MTAETDLDAPFAPDWVLVPRTPTDAMLRAAQDAWMNDPLRRTTTMWRAMLAAAPQQPAAVDGAKETDLWRCTVCGRVGTVGRCCGEETRERANMEPLQAKVEALRAEVAVERNLKADAIHACALANIRAERLAEALAGLITWIPSADTYRRLGFDPEAPMRALEEARAALDQEEGK